MSRKIKQALQNIMERFKNGDIPKAIAYSTFPIPNIPAAKWSLLNRTFMFMAGTRDARGKIGNVSDYVDILFHFFCNCLGMAVVG